MRKIDRECPVCGRTYKVNADRLERWGRGVTCSRECQYISNANKMKRRISLVCATCGAEFSRRPSSIKGKYGAQYCSRPCHYKGRRLGLSPRIVTRPYRRIAPPPSPEVAAERSARRVATRRARDNYRKSDHARARLRETTARAIAEGRIPRVSKLEYEVAEVLDRLGVRYDHSVGLRDSLGRYCAALDFLLADGRALEVNGTFWHADPRVYPDGPVHPAQIRTAAAWERKLAVLESQGIPLIVLWEQDFRDNPAEAVRVALSGVGEIVGRVRQDGVD